MDSPEVFIVILNYNGGEDLCSCLESVFGLEYAKYKVVLVDNASVDGSFEKACRLFPEVFAIKNNKNLGFAAGNNVGIKFSLGKGADCVILLNNDTLVSRNFLGDLIPAFFQNPISGIGSPVILNRQKKLWFCGGKIDWFRMKTLHFDRIKSEKPYFSGFITGCSMAIKREVFEKVGFLDEDFFLYYEDADFSLRAQKAGFKGLIVPSSKIIHLERSEENSENKIYWLVLSGLIFFRKNSSRLVSLWQSLYLVFRKTKNRLDIKRRGNRIDLAVRRAYLDFERKDEKRKA